MAVMCRSFESRRPMNPGDLLFQNNTNNQMGLWTMNGANVTGIFGLFNPGAGWQSENGHPFAAG
jgi:hypothetical protein